MAVKVLIALLTAILTLVLGSVAFICMYAGVPDFREMVDYAVSFLPEPAPEDDETLSVPVPVLAETEGAENTESAESAESAGNASAAGTGSGNTTAAEPTFENNEQNNTTGGNPNGVPDVGEIIERPADGIMKPSESADLNVPENLKERAELVPIREVAETVTDAQADEIEQTLTTGPTGDDLTFDQLFYPYYHMINDQAKQLYRQIYANTAARNAKFRAVDKNIGFNDIQNAYVACYYDHPEFYWMDRRFSTYYRQNGDFLEIDIQYNGAETGIKEYQSISDGVLEELKAASTDYDREKRAHDWLTEQDTYNMSSPRNQSAYSAIVEKITVCAGYARAMQYLMQQNGIPCYLCTGYAGEAHAWNIICLDGEYYNLDVTWDDTDDSSVQTYDWFNLTDTEFSPTHMRQGLSVNLPPCNGTTYSNRESNPTSDGIKLLVIQNAA